MSDKIAIHSYRRVFEVDRRIYRVDRWALPVPGGVPLSGVAWFLLAETLVIFLSFMPGIGQLPSGDPGLLRVLPWPLVYLVLPTLAAVLGTQATPDGRPAHRFGLDWIRLRMRAPRRCGDLTVPEEGDSDKWARRVAFRWDADAPSLQRAHVRGPATVTFNVPVRFGGSWRGRVVARPKPDGRTGPLDVNADVSLEVKPRR